MSETQFREAFVEIFGASETTCAPHSLSDYLVSIAELGGGLTPYGLTSLYLHPRFNLGPLTPSLIVTNGSADDLFLYHLARQAEILTPGKPLVVVPISELQAPEAFIELSNWLRSHTHGNLLNIASATLEMGYLREIQKALKPYMSDWQINIQCGNFDLIAPIAFYTERQSMVYDNGSTLSFETPSIEFASFISGMSKWVVEIKQTWPTPLRSGFTPSMFPSLNQLLSGYHADKTRFQVDHDSERRIARGNLAVQANRETDITKYSLPNSEQLITTALQDAGFQVSYDEKGRYYEGMIRLAGNTLNALNFLREDGILSLFHALKDGRGLTWRQVLGETRPGKDGSKCGRLQEIILDLADKQILLRGVNLRCPTCDLETWYPFETLGEHIECQGCRTLFQMGLNNVSFCYRANQLYIQGIRNGAKTVLLTALLLQNSSLSGMHWKAGCKVTLPDRPFKSDLDLVAMCDGGLIITECKDDLEKEFSEKPDETLEQIQRSVESAKIAKADLFILSTWSSQVPQPIREALEAAVDKSTRLNVHTLTKEELLRGWIEEKAEDQSLKRKFIDRFFKQLPRLEGDCFEYDPETSAGSIAFG